MEKAFVPLIIIHILNTIIGIYCITVNLFGKKRDSKSNFENLKENIWETTNQNICLYYVFIFMILTFIYVIISQIIVICYFVVSFVFAIKYSFGHLCEILAHPTNITTNNNETNNNETNNPLGNNV